jgi:hypothetical protein
MLRFFSHDRRSIRIDGARGSFVGFRLIDGGVSRCVDNDPGLDFPDRSADLVRL